MAAGRRRDALLLLAPWLPPKSRRKEGFHLLVHPDNRIVPVREGESLLEAALRAEIRIPFDCRNGGCGVCKSTLLYGNVDYGDYQETALSAAERATGKLLPCCATPLSDLEIEYEPAGGAGKAPRSGSIRHASRSMKRLTHDVMS